MKDGASEQQIQAVKEGLKSMGIDVHSSTRVTQAVLVIVEDKEIDTRKIERLGRVSEVKGTTIVMPEGATEAQIQAVKKRAELSGFVVHGPAPLIRTVLGIAGSRGFDASKIKGLDGVMEVLEGTGWARFLRKYLEATRRERRNEINHPLRDFTRFGPPVNTVVASLVPPLRGCLSPRGSSGTGSMKNPPDGFYQDKCKES
jgi:hypothetical protein